MQFTSIAFPAALFVLLLVYYFIPERNKNVLLLTVSYAFYAAFGLKYALLLLITTLVTWYSGLLLSKDNVSEKIKNTILIISSLLAIGFLFVYKYLDFSIGILERVFSVFRSGISFKKLNLIMPVGISFYTFKALSYLFDMRKGKYAPVKNITEYALYISFFPAILSGPIDRPDVFIPQLRKEHKFDYNKVRAGALLMLWGYFLKLVVSDRIYQFTSAAYAGYKNYPGSFLLIAALLYSIEIYCDFWGYSSIARGIAGTLGFEITENFRQPYFAQSIAEFWRKWHISLSSWLKDYVYIPLGGSRCSKVRRYFNILVTFLISGLWHGAGLSFVIWGLLHGFYQIAGSILEPARKKWLELIKVDRDSSVHKMVKRINVYLLVSFAWIFFAASSTRDALAIILRIVKDFNLKSLFDRSFFETGISRPDCFVLFLGGVVLLIVDYLKNKKFNIQGWISRQHVLFRWFIYLTAVFSIIIFGVYGIGYEAASFVYFQF